MSTRSGTTAVYGANGEDGFAPNSSLDVLFRCFLLGTQVDDVSTLL